MVASQNGWAANDRSKVASQLIPGSQVKVTVRKDAPGLLLLEVASAFDRQVQDIDNARGALDDWGYAERPIRGSLAVSNHASGTAIDLNATRWALGKPASVNLSPAQIGTVRKIVAATGGVIRWGGDYTGRTDPMHFEVNDGQDLADCERALAAMRKYNSGVAPAPTQPSDGSVSGDLRRGSTGEPVKRLQRVLAAWYPDLRLVVDGDYGPATEAAVKRLQAAKKLAVDGIAGRATLGALGL